MSNEQMNAAVMARMRAALSLQDQLQDLPEGTILTITAGKLAVVHGHDKQPVTMPELMTFLRDREVDHG